MANVDDARHLQVFKLDGRRNKMEFIRGFPGVAARFGIEGIIYEGTPRPGAAEELAEARANWDRLNRLALEKLRFYVSTRVDDIVTDGEDLTARQYYQRLNDLFLNLNAESLSTLHLRLAACKYVEGEEVFAWLARLAAIFAQFQAAGSPIPDLEKKHRAMSLISEARMWGAMSHLLGTGDNVSYKDWQTAMLRKEEEFEQNGCISGQGLADNLYGKKDGTEGVFQATALHQTYRGSGFNSRASGFGRGRNQFNRNMRGRMAIGPRAGFVNVTGSITGQRSNNGIGYSTRSHGSGRYWGRESGMGRGGWRPSSQRGSSMYGSKQCYNCGEWGHHQRQCNQQKVNISTDEYDVDSDGYCYYPNSDYYYTYRDDNGEQKQEEQGVYNLMVRILEPNEDKALVAAASPNFNINLDSYCTRHMTPCYELHNQEPCVVNIMVGNKELLQSTHKGSLRLGNIIFEDVLFVPGLLQTLISEPQLEIKGCKIVSEHGIRTISRNGKYLFHATLERNSYVFRPQQLGTNSRLYSMEEVALVAKPVPVDSAELWHLRLGHLNYSDMCKLKGRSTGLAFHGEICFCETCVVSKMRAKPFQNQGDKSNIQPKQNICYDVSGPFPPTVEGFIYSFNAICKKTGKRWRGAGRHKSESADFLTQLIAKLDNTAIPAGRVETLTSDHGGEVTSNEFQRWLKDKGIFHLTAPRQEPNYNAVIERSSAVVETMGFAMLRHASKPRSWWNLAFDYATYILDRCPRRTNQHSITPFEAFFKEKPDLSEVKIFGCLSFAHVLPVNHQHLQPRAKRGIFVGFDEKRRGVRVVLDGERKFSVHRSVTFYEQSLLDAMKTQAKIKDSEGVDIPSLPELQDTNSDELPIQSSSQNSESRQSSMSFAQDTAEEKSHKRTAERSRKEMMSSPIPSTPRPHSTPRADSNTKVQRPSGKYSRLKRELSLPMKSAHTHIVCNVTVETTDNGSEDFSTNIQHAIAAHTQGGDGSDAFSIPKTVTQALAHEDAEFWKAAMLDEMVNHEEVFGTFGPPIPRTKGIKATPTRFLFSKKIVSLQERKQDSKSLAYKSIPNSIDYERFRARLLYVNNPYTSKQSSWEELFAPVVDKTSVRIFLTTCAMMHKHLLHLDVVSAYLHATLPGPARYITLWGDEENMVRQLFKALNGIDNAAKLWNKHYDSFMLREGFLRSCRDNCIYIHPETNVQSSLYVDDVLAAADPDKKHELTKFVRKVQKQFVIRILGEPTKFLGMEITYLREQGICCITQQSYVEKLVATFLSEHDSTVLSVPTTPVEINVYDKLRLAHEEPDFTGPYRSIVGGLLFLFVCTRMDIGFAMSLLTQQLAKPKPTHFLLAKRVLAYVNGTKTYGLVLGGEPIAELNAFSDASFANDQTDRKSMGGYILFLGNSPISWSAKKHRGVVAVSSCESEIVQVSESFKEILWCQPLIIDLGFPAIESQTVLHGDNQPASHVLLNNPTHSARTKHMDVKVKFCGEVLAKKDKILLKYVPSKLNFADIFTKPLGTVRFRDLRSILIQDLSGISSNAKFIQRTFTVLKDFIKSPAKSPVSIPEQSALY